MKHGGDMDKDVLLTFGSAVKLYEDGRIGGYLVKFTDPEHHDLEGEYFDARTDYDITDGAKTSVYLNHRQPLPLKDGRLVSVKEKIGEGTLKVVGEGVLIEAILYNADQYKQVLDKLGWSSGTAPHLVEYDDPLPSGIRHISRWPLGLDASITPMPANPWGSAVMPFKSLYSVSDDATEPEPEDTPEGSNPGTSGKATKPELETQPIMEDREMAEEKENATVKAELDPGVIADAVRLGVEEAMKSWQSTQPVVDTGVLVSQHDNREDAPFKSFGDQLQAVAYAAAGNMDPRLAKFKASGQSEGIPSDGGFLVQEDFTQELYNLSFGKSEILSRCRSIPISGNSEGITMTLIDETSRAAGSRWGSLQTYWAAEGATVTAETIKFRQVRLALNKMFGIGYATAELLQDTSALEAVMSMAFGDEMTFKAEDAILNGSGAGRPLGVVGAGGTHSTTAESGQAASTFLAENALAMWSHLHPAFRANAVWLINPDVEPQLFKMSLSVGTGGALVYMPPGGLADSPYARLMGRPVIPVEHCQTLGTVGDVVLGDFRQYLLAQKAGIRAAQSMHVRFLYDEMTYRFTWRLDGQPKFASVLTPAHGTNYLAAFVTLASRS